METSLASGVGRGLIGEESEVGRGLIGVERGYRCGERGEESR